MEFKDYYATLGLTKGASEAEIKRAYRKLARQYHPDLNPGDKAAEARFKELNEANEVLGDPDKRRKYDELGANWRAYENASPNGGGGEWPGAHGGAGGATYRTMTPEEMQDLFGGEDPFSDFFHTFFGGASGGGARAGRAARGARPGKGQDYEHAVDLTLEDVLQGTTRRLSMKRDGQERTIEVRIPAGVNDGARVRAAGEGAPSRSGGAAGDLYLKVRVLPHAHFERRGRDLHAKIDIPITTAVLGGELAVPALGGASLRLKVPELTGNGRVFRLRGHGLPAVGKPGDRGDLYVTATVKVPSQLTDDERRHYEALRETERQRQR